MLHWIRECALSPQSVMIGIMILLALLTGRPCFAESYGEDFETADPTVWSNETRPKAGLVERDGNRMLHIDGRQQQTLAIPAEARRDFDLTVQIRGPGGVHFRDDFKVFFKGNGNVWIRRPGAMLLRWVRQRRDISVFHTMRVVAAGRIVRIYIDETLELEFLDHDPKAGRFAFCGSGDFDNLRIRDELPQSEALMAVPKDAGADFFEERSYERMQLQNPRVPDIALAFERDEAVQVPVRVLNEGSKKADVAVHASLDDFGDEQLARAEGKTVNLAGQSETIVDMDFGVVPRGFHRMKLSALHEDETLRTIAYPIFVGVPAEPVALRQAAVPFAVMLKKVVWKPIHTKTYWHAIASLLREHHVNTVVSGGAHREFPEIFQHYGVWTLVRSENRLDHPAVIGMVNWNKRPDRMKELQTAFDKPVLTYLPAEKIGTGGPEDPLEIWRQTTPDIRMVRLAPFRAGDGNWLTHERELPLPEALHRTYTAAPTPWWAMLQTTNDPENAEGGRVPSPAEVRAQTHLALACGAKGLVYHALQSGVEMSAMVDRLSLSPVDERLRTVAELGALVARHDQAIAGFEPVAAPVRCRPEAVVMVRAQKHVYLVNTDVLHQVNGPVELPLVLPRRVKDVYSGDILLTSPTKSGVTVEIEMPPGDGRCLRLE